MKRITSYRKCWQFLISKSSKFIGFIKVSKAQIVYVLLSLLAGIMFNALLLHITAIVKNGKVYAECLLWKST